jgi:hypothetical protein
MNDPQILKIPGDTMWNHLYKRILPVLWLIIFSSSAFTQAPMLIIDPDEYHICEGDVAHVWFYISGQGEFGISYVLDGDTTEWGASSNHFVLDFEEPGTYVVVAYRNITGWVYGVSDTFRIIEYEAPQVSFTGGGVNCSDGVLDPLIGHFSGNPDFSFIFEFNGERDTLDFGLSDVAFPTDTTFTLIALSLEDNNCQTTLEDTAYYMYIEVPEPLIYGEDEVCETESMEYRAGHIDYAVDWDISGAVYETDSTAEGYIARVTWTETGEQEVRLQYTEYEYNCATDWKTLPVSVYPMPETFAIDTAVCFQLDGDLALHFDVDPGDVLYWPELAASGSIMALQSTGFYHIIHTNRYNCVDTSRIRVVSSCVAQLYVPEAFTPGNRDGLNDRLEIFGFFTDLDFSIYSPSGILVFRTTEDPLMFWDGTYGPYRKEMPAGSYYWTAVYAEGDGEPHKKSGVVTLIR